MFQSHRIFCATAWEMEEERIRFYQAVGEFNENAAMPRGVLFVPVSLVNIGDKRPLQYLIDENIRACRHYILVHGGNWGPRERNFRYDYHLALECLANPALPMAAIATLRGTPHPYIPADPPSADMPAPDAEFSGAEEFQRCLPDLFSAWLEAIA